MASGSRPPAKWPPKPYPADVPALRFEVAGMVHDVRHHFHPRVTSSAIEVHLTETLKPMPYVKKLLCSKLKFDDALEIGSAVLVRGWVLFYSDEDLELVGRTDIISVHESTVVEVVA